MSLLQVVVAKQLQWITNSGLLIRSICSNSGINFAKKDYPFVFVRPVKIPSVFTSGDKEPLQKLDPSTPTLTFSLCKNLENLSPVVRKLISIEYARPKDTLILQKLAMIKKVRRHVLDNSSMEVTIARLTVTIRYRQGLLQREKLPKKAIRQKIKVNLLNDIGRRDKKLRMLRKLDYERFEWLLDTLKISYRPQPLFFHWTTRKGTLRVMTREHCNKLRKEKIDAYKSKLKAMQDEFMKEKEETLKWVEKEKLELGITDLSEHEVLMKEKLEEYKVILKAMVETAEVMREKELRWVEKEEKKLDLIKDPN